MTASATLLHSLSADLASVTSARIAAQRECRRESARLKDIALLCDFFNNNGLKDESWMRSSELSDVSTIDESRGESDSLDAPPDGSSCETLDALRLEERLVSAEMTYLADDRVDDDDDEVDDDLREFQKIEREIKVQELEKCLENVRKQIADKHRDRQRARRPADAPLADAESFDDRDDDDRRRRWQRRPLTLYLPVADKELDLAQHIRDLGHDLTARPELCVTAARCCGSLHKLCQKSDNKWRKRYFVFDRQNACFAYFASKSHFERKRKPKGGVAFAEIRDVFVDHVRTQSERFVFAVSAQSRRFVLSTPTAEVMRIWVDALCTGALSASDVTDFY